MAFKKTLNKKANKNTKDLAFIITYRHFSRSRSYATHLMFIDYLVGHN